MDTILNFIQANMPLIILVVVAIFVIRSGIFGRIGEAIGGAFGSAVPAVAVVVLALIMMFGVITIFRPQFYTFLWGPGPLGPGQQVSRAEANLQGYILDPANNPDLWSNSVAKTAARTLESRYGLERAKNLSAISAEEADKACHLPKWDPGRIAWDSVGMDPCESALNSSVLVAARVVSKVDLDATEKDLSQAIGSPPPGADNWVRQLYHLPKGAVFSGILVLLMVVVGLVFRSVVR